MECPDKLEPREPQYLTSVLKNVPVELMWHLREYHSKPSHFEIKWRARQPVEGKKYGYGGDLKWEDAQSGDMYVRDRSLEQKYQHLQDVNRNLTNKLDDRILYPGEYLEYRGEDSRTFIDKSKGIYLYDKTGHKMIDGPGGMWNVNVGHGVKEIADAIHEQIRKIDRAITSYRVTGESNSVQPRKV